MYTLPLAASILRISQSTLRNWIAQANIRTIPVEMDRRRMYLLHRDLTHLAAAHQRKIAPPTTVTELPKNHPDPDLYTLAEAAKCLNVSHGTLRKWLTQHNIAYTHITTDHKHLYITVHDIAKLMCKHRWTRHYNTTTTRPKDPSDQSLYTIYDAARYLGVHPDTVRRWLKQHNISKKTRTTDKRRIYIEELDILQLANLHARKPKTKDLCSIAEAARYLGVSRQTLGRRLEQHHILTHIIGTTGQRICIDYTDVIRLEFLHPKKPTDPTLLTPKEAAAFLGISKSTLEKWLVQYNIPKQRPDPTNRRVYIHALDVAQLEMLYPQKTTASSFLTPKEAAAYLGVSRRTLENWLTQYDIPKHSSSYLHTRRVHIRRSDIVELARLHPKKPTDNSLLTLNEAAAHLGISQSTLRRWLTRHAIPTQRIDPTSRCVYLHHTDVVKLAQLHPKRRQGNT